MRLFPESPRVLWYGTLVVALLLPAGCSHPPPTTPAGSRIALPGHKLTPTEAAALAAQLANEECHRRYARRPFTPGQYPARRTDDGYRWGRLEVGAPGGLSAVVVFAPDGSNPKVEVYFSTDILMPRVPAVDPSR